MSDFDPKRIQCVVFDIDDTLYLERDYAYSGFASVGEFVDRRMGVTGFAGVASRLFDAGVRGRIFDEALPRLGITAEPVLVRTLVDLYRSHFPTIRLPDDARWCLDSLSSRYQLAGVTDGPTQSQSAKIVALGLRRWLSPVVQTAALGTDASKPSPRGFSTIERRTGFRGATCVYVADNPGKDFRGPKGLGWQTVRVRRSGGLHAAVGGGNDVDHEIDDLRALVEALAA